MTLPADAVDDTRARLVAAAAEVFSEKGYDRAGVQEIARRAGLTTGAIYGRFSGKAELLKEAIESRSSDELDHLFNHRSFEGHATDVLRTVGAHLVQPERRHAEGAESALLLEAFVAARRDPEVAVVIKGVLEDRAARLGAVVEAAKVDGSLDPGVDTDAIVRFCHALGLGFLLFDSVGTDTPSAAPWASLIGRLVDALAPDTSASNAPHSTGGTATDDETTDPTTEGDPTT